MQVYQFATVGSIIEQATNEAIGSTASQITALQNKALIQYVDNINQSFIVASQIRHHAGGWSWMEGSENFQTINDTVLGANLATTDSSATITTTTGWPTAGRFWIRTAKGSIDFVDYTGLSGSTVTGITGVGIPHVAGESVGICYATPTDFGKMRRMIVNTVEYFFDDRRYLLPYWGSYKLRQNYIVLPQSTQTSSDVTYWYEKKATILSNSTSTNDTTAADLLLETNIPTYFNRYGVEALKGYIFNVRRKPDLAQMCEMKAQQEVDAALSFDCVETAAFSGLRSNY
jgi:hypothetical protein